MKLKSQDAFGVVRDQKYRVNGKEVRLKDVQLLFADASTGARSTSMVSQGRVGAVIVAKPEQRRTLLEESCWNKQDYIQEGMTPNYD